MGLKLASTIPNDGLAPTSWSVYQKACVDWKAEHATLFQYVSALATLATASFSVGPETGHPDSVIQTTSGMNVSKEV